MTRENTKQPDATIVLLHGAGLGSWIWNEAKIGLILPSLVIDFPARTDTARRKQLSFADYVEGVVNNIEQGCSTGKIILVAHSISGVVALRVAERLGDRLIGFAAIAAAIPAGKGSFLSCLPFPQKYVMNLIMRVAGTKPPVSAIRQGLCSDLDSERANEVATKFAEESLSLYTTPCGALPPSCPALYVVTGDDKEFPVSLQRKMAERLGATIKELPGGHMPMLGHPKELAAALNVFAADTLED